MNQGYRRHPQSAGSPLPFETAATPRACRSLPGQARSRIGAMTAQGATRVLRALGREGAEP